VELILAHSPDADDAYMFYGIAKTSKFKFREFLADIETLNKLAIEGLLDVSAVSVHALGYLDGYYVLRVGASMGIKYGPVIVGRGATRVKYVAIPGAYTTAALLTKLAMPDVKTIEIPYDKIVDAVSLGIVDAGVLIHEAQLYYRDYNLTKILDLGEWWYDLTKLPTPLGVNVVKKSLGEDVARMVKEALSNSIKYADEHRDEAIEFASKFARGLPMEKLVKFVDMYVNEYTRDMGQIGERAIRELLEMAYSRRLIKSPEVEFV